MVVKYRFRLFLFSIVVLGAFAALLYRLNDVMVRRHDELSANLPTSQKLKARVPGIRGEIKDRNGVVLATNKPSFEVRINLKDLVDEKLRQLKMQAKAKEVVKLPKKTYTIKEGNFIRNRTEDDIVAILEELVVAPLKPLGLAKEDYDDNNLRVHYRTNKGAVPWVYRSDLTFEQFSKFAEHNYQLPGVTPEVRAVRQYLYDSMACHILGYVRLPDVGLISKEEQAKWDYAMWDDFGVAGVEKTLDEHLKGVPGVKVMLKNEKGAVVGEIQEEFIAPKQGNDVWLTLDARMQTIVETALRTADNGGPLGRASAVVIDPNNGEVLAMAAVPSYNPNKFIPKIQEEHWEEYRQNKINPLMNRAISQYAPGSTFKVLTAFAGCIRGMQGASYSCPGGVQYGNKYMKCWIAEKGGSHGTLGLSDAIMRSCNCYFYRLGNDAGLDMLGKAGKMLGIGERTGIELEDEKTGVLPAREWMQLNKPQENWRSPGHIANTSIGQGMVECTPLQICSMAATVANAGKSYKPHLMKKIMRGDQFVAEPPPAVRADLAAEGITPAQIELIRRGMWKVVNGEAGTGKAAQIPGTEVAGKTGTAQFWDVIGGELKKDNHTWFMSFAPYNNPKFACVVMIQGGKSGGSCPGPVAQRILRQCLDLEQGLQIQVAKVKEEPGFKKSLEAVHFPDDGPQLPTANADDPDEGAGGDGEKRMVREETSRSARDDDDSHVERRNTRKPRSSTPRSSTPAPRPTPPPPTPPPAERRGLLQRLFNG
jgi:penicillin-binding protein 2